MGSQGDDAETESDFEFMKDLQHAKQKLGSPIGYETTEEAETAAANAQNAFLEAMKAVKEEFQQSKEEVGVDKAIDLIKSQWDMEDALMEVSDDDLDRHGEFE